MRQSIFSIRSRLAHKGIMAVDAVYVKAGLEREKAATLVVTAALNDGSKRVLSAEPGCRGRSSRNMGSAEERLSRSGWQRCWNHKLMNVLDRLPKRDQIRRIPYAETKKESEHMRNLFSRWCAERGHEPASEALERDWERMVAFYDYSKEYWQHLRTTNPVESPFASLRLRTDAASAASGWTVR